MSFTVNFNTSVLQYTSHTVGDINMTFIDVEKMHFISLYLVCSCPCLDSIRASVFWSSATLLFRSDGDL